MNRGAMFTKPAGKGLNRVGLLRLSFSEAIMKKRTMARKLEHARVQAREVAVIACSCLSTN